MDGAALARRAGARARPLVRHCARQSQNMAATSRYAPHKLMIDSKSAPSVDCQVESQAAPASALAPPRGPHSLPLARSQFDDQAPLGAEFMRPLCARTTRWASSPRPPRSLIAKFRSATPNIICDTSARPVTSLETRCASRGARKFACQVGLWAVHCGGGGGATFAHISLGAGGNSL